MTAAFYVNVSFNAILIVHLYSLYEEDLFK